MAGNADRVRLKIAIVGAGPSGLLLALYLLQNRGRIHPWEIALQLFERESDHDQQDRSNPDRSYTIDITGHGLKAVRRAGKALARRFDRELIPFNGIHAYLIGKTLPYDEEGGWTGSRGDICSALLHELRATGHGPEALTLHWNCTVSAIDANTGALQYRSGESENEASEQFDLIVGADGAGSVVRRHLEQQTHLRCQKSSIPNYSRILKLDKNNASEVLDPSLLHMFSLMPWAVGGAILDIGPATDTNASDFSAANTPKQLFVQMGYPSDRKFNGIEDVRQMLGAISVKVPARNNESSAERFTLLDFVSDEELESFANRAVYHTGKTVVCSQLYGGKCVLLGDAATAFPPVGQGVNAALEAAVVLGDNIVQSLVNNPAPETADTDLLVREFTAHYNHTWLPEARACAAIANSVKYGSRLNMLTMLLQGIISQLTGVEMTGAQLAKSSTDTNQSALTTARFRNRTGLAIAVLVTGAAVWLF